MGTIRAEDLERIGRLNPGEAMVLHDIDWDDYEHLVDELLEGRHLRVSYDEGTVEVVSPGRGYEVYGRFIDLLVHVLADVRGVDVESAGSTTWKKCRLAKAVEPDACFHVKNAARVIGKTELDLEIDPPPDVVVEIEISRRALNKLRIYAALGVAEIWTYDGKRTSFYELVAGGYQIVHESPSFVGLTPTMLTEALEHSKTDGQTAALRRFRDSQQRFRLESD